MSSALELDGQQQSHSLHVTRLWPWPRPSSVRGTGICTLSFALPSLFLSMDVSPSPSGPREPKPVLSQTRHCERPLQQYRLPALTNRNYVQPRRFTTFLHNRPTTALHHFGSANMGSTQSNDACLRLSPCSAAETASTMIGCSAVHSRSEQLDRFKTLKAISQRAAERQASNESAASLACVNLSRCASTDAPRC